MNMLKHIHNYVQNILWDFDGWSNFPYTASETGTYELLHKLTNDLKLGLLPSA